jgi:TetR/AcrR family transcriptional regulator
MLEFPEWTSIHTHILALEEAGLVTRTFRRLDPQRQQAILQAILDEAIEVGPTSINIKNIAARAAVAVGSLYNYFGSRDNLLAFTVEICTRYVLDMFAAFQPYLVAMPLREALAGYLQGGLEWSETQAGLVQFFVRAAYQGDETLYPRCVEPIAEMMLAIVTEMLSQAVARGEVRPDVDLEATAHLINATLLAVGDSQLLPYLNRYLRVSDEKVPFPRVVEALLDLILAGIMVEGTAGQTPESAA